MEDPSEEIPYHDKCEKPVVLCECLDAQVRYNWETGMFYEVDHGN